MTEIKKCTMCDTEKPLTDYRVHTSTKDGRFHQCNECLDLYKPGDTFKAQPTYIGELCEILLDRPRGATRDQIHSRRIVNAYIMYGNMYYVPQYTDEYIEACLNKKIITKTRTGKYKVSSNVEKYLDAWDRKRKKAGLTKSTKERLLSK